MERRGVDVVVVGAGIVGLATARELLVRHPGLRLVVLDKEERVGRGQTGHNSGVLHSGIYYRPGTLKAELCVRGRRSMLAYCEERGLRVDAVGKIVLATREDELAAQEELLRRGSANGVEGLRLLDERELREVEPEARGLRALHVPGAAILDFAAVCGALAEDIVARGARLRLGQPLAGAQLREAGISLRLRGGTLDAAHLVNCAGLHCDTVARRLGARTEVRILPFRGEYWVLRPERRGLVRGLIYPVPDPRLPFLGVHFTRTVHGEVEAGPNAVLALAREGYRRRDIDPGHLAGVLLSPGVWRMARRWWRTGLAEMHRSVWPGVLLRDLRRLLPGLRAEDLRRGGSGVRAQALDRDGKLLDDFHVIESERALHVLNAPSPAATAALAIAEHLADRAERSFGLA